MNIRPMTLDERKYAYDQSQQLTGQTGCVGRLDGTLDGDNFPTSWTGRWVGLDTDEFRADLDTVLQALRHEGCALADRYRMQSYCLDHLDAIVDTGSLEYGFRMDTDKYAYLLRLSPREGGVRLYCYIREHLERHMENAMKGIRFITPGYDELFRLRDGEKVRITTSDGRTLDRTCRYIDETHLEVGACPRTELYHICQFAELMERAGNKVEPLKAPACAIRNLTQLKKCLRTGSRLEIVGHHRSERIGQVRKVTLANTQGFYSIAEGQPPDSVLNRGNDGKGQALDWSKAPFWTFRDGVCGLYSDREHDEKNLIMAFRVLTDAA